MTDFDLDRLGDVWRQQPDPAEMERLQRSAAAVGRRARWGHFVDVAAALGVTAVVVALVLYNPKTDTFLIGSIAILALLISQFRQRQLRQIELKSLSGGTEEMLDQSIGRVEATLKRNRFSLIAIGPAILLGLMFASAADQRGMGNLVRLFQDAGFGPVLIGVIVAIAVVTAGLLFSIRNGRRQLGRLTALREAYRRENDSSTA